MNDDAVKNKGKTIKITLSIEEHQKIKNIAEKRRLSLGEIRYGNS